MYCTKCSCPSCVALRITSGGYDGAKEDVIRIIVSSGERGMTLAELRKYSRPFRTLDDEQQALMLDRLVSSNVIVLQHFPTKVGRGRSRDAFVMSIKL